ncbi:MAG: ABC transporter permease, partial [Phaeovulum sp.]|nr:ABC transporter permease [Phaeovulum sp.]
MFNFALRRFLIAIPTLLIISLVIFMLLEAAPGDPLGDVPLTVPPDVKEKMRAALGLDSAWYVRYFLWMKQFFWVEPLNLVDYVWGTDYAKGMHRVISFQSRQPVMQIIAERVPQTLTVVGMSYL